MQRSLVEAPHVNDCENCGKPIDDFKSYQSIIGEHHYFCEPCLIAWWEKVERENPSGGLLAALLS